MVFYSKQCKEAIKLYEQMQQSKEKPTEHVFVAVLKACVSMKAITQGKNIHSNTVESGLESDLYVGSCLMEMYIKCGSLVDAQKVFENLSKQDVVSWTTMVAGYAQSGYGLEAFHLFQQMQSQGIQPNIVTFVSILKACSSTVALTQGKLIHAQVTSYGFESDLYVGSTLVDLYVKCGHVQDARKVFDKLHKQDVVACSTMIAGYSQHGYSLDAIEFLQRMQEKGLKASNITFVPILHACSSGGALSQGKLVHIHIIASGFKLDAYVVSTIINMYAKCGSLPDACMVFDNWPEQTVVTWSAMIAGYTLQSDYKSALQSFKAMRREGLEPDVVTLVTVLSACSHVGLVSEGCHVFQYMREKHGIIPVLEHYTCLIDLLGRSGCLIEAEDLVKTMPFMSNIAGWISLLGNSRIYGDIELGQRCFDTTVSLDPNHACGYVLLSNIYNDADLWKDAHCIQDLRKYAYAAKQPGNALIEVDEKVHSFIVGDQTHTQAEQFNAKLNKLIFQMREEGHVLIRMQ